MIGTKILEEQKSKYNGDLKVVRSLGLGTYIQSDGLTQSGGIVESIWKSTLRKIKSAKTQINDCLILGLGGGTVVKLIRKYWPEANITGVDIDPVIVELGRKYLGLKKDDVNIKIGDASKFTKEKYDLVIVDLYNGYNFPKKFEDENFLKSLTKNNLVIINRLYFGDKRPLAVKFGLKLQKIFKGVENYYPEANLMFLCYNR
jgi:spermidine synthase